ncbi:hypothetical protein FD754_024813 [Muntiacus muntjak]|uniref:Mos1 transposase HTH domain-containing protein n=1 Tax=Muntiacus muntjak TaxID=9888 RepID=A0A5N3UN18_MUNMU|nr:hypothetical protein FD754_024813 [Muntiacus muntjak]
MTFLCEFKLGQKAAETTHIINNAFGPGTANEQTVQWWFKKFCKRDQITEADSLTTTRSCPRTQHKPFYNHHFEVSLSLILCSDNKPFLNWIVTCDDKWILYDDQQQPPNLHQKKVMVTGPILLQDNIQIHVAQPTLQKLNNLDYEVFSHSPHLPDLSPTNYHFFKHLDNFLQRKCFLNQQKAENAFQESVKSQSTNFYATAINKLIFHWQKCIDCNGSHFD